MEVIDANASGVAEAAVDIVLLWHGMALCLPTQHAAVPER
jgi:hypothetical protein